MKCCEQLDDYLDGDLTPLEREAFLREAATCPACQAALESARWMDQSLRLAWEEVRIPEWEKSNSLQVSSRPNVGEDSSQIVHVRSNRTNATWINRSLVSWSAVITCSLLIGFTAWWLHSKLNHSDRPRITKNGESTLKGSDNQRKSQAPTVQSPSDLVVQRYDNEGITIGGPYIGYKAADEDDFTLVMVYRLPADSEPNNSDSEPTTDKTDFD